MGTNVGGLHRDRTVVVVLAVDEWMGSRWCVQTSESSSEMRCRAQKERSPRTLCRSLSLSLALTPLKLTLALAHGATTADLSATPVPRLGTRPHAGSGTTARYKFPVTAFAWAMQVPHHRLSLSDPLAPQSRRIPHQSRGPPSIKISCAPSRNHGSPGSGASA